MLILPCCAPCCRRAVPCGWSSTVSCCPALLCLLPHLPVRLGSFSCFFCTYSPSSCAKPKASSASSARMRVTSSSHLSSTSAGRVKVRCWGETGRIQTLGPAASASSVLSYIRASKRCRARAGLCAWPVSLDIITADQHYGVCPELLAGWSV